MIGALREKSIAVMVVESVASIRRLIASNLKELGFQNIETYESLKDAKKSIYRIGPKWVVTSVYDRDAFNVISLLDATLKDEVLSDCLVSVLADGANQDILPDAFQLGLLSCHPQVTTAATLKNEFNQFFKVCQDSNWNLSAVAAHYLFVVLAGRKDYDDLTASLSNCLTLFPDHAGLAIKHAESLFIQGKTDQAVMMLRHAKSKFPDAKLNAEKLCQNYLGSSLATVIEQQTFAEANGMRSAAIVDSDEATVKALTSIFKELGFLEISSFQDGPSFYNWLADNADIDIIVCEWKIPKSNGPALIQRVRMDQSLSAPLIIHSSVVQDKDRVLLKELGVTDVITKPMYHKILGQELKAIINADIAETQADVLVNHIRGSLRKKEFAPAQTYLDRLKQSDAPDYIKQYLEAEVLLAMGEPLLAKNLAISALNTGGESLGILDLLGRILLKLKEFDLAKKFLDKAAKISPENIERLCLQAEVATELGDSISAESSFSKASKIDSDSSTLIETKATLATLQGDADLVKSLMQKLRSGDGVVGRLNNRAVSLVKEGKGHAALDLYKQALKAVAGDDPDLGGVLRYNISLSLIRMGDTRQAAAVLAEIKDPKKTRVGSKVTSLAQRVEKSLATGTPLASKEGDPALPELEPVTAPYVPIYRNIRPGTRALYLIYQRSQPLTEKATIMLGRS